MTTTQVRISIKSGKLVISPANATTPDCQRFNSREAAVAYITKTYPESLRTRSGF